MTMVNIITRAEWGAKPARRRHRISLPTPELWLHHSAGAGSDEPAVRNIQNFHMGRYEQNENGDWVLVWGRGWSDIAYSFLLDDDEDPEIFEGRGPGIAGGHTKGHNTISHALCVIGNFTHRPPKDATLELIIALAVFGYWQGWWRAGFTGGHRDASGASTQCPGDALHALIPTLNAEIHRRIANGEGDDMSQFTDKQAKILRAFADQIEEDGSDGAGFAHWLLKLYRNIRSTFTG